MRIERIICDRCGFEQQEDDYIDAAWDHRFKGDICRRCAGAPRVTRARNDATEPQS